MSKSKMDKFKDEQSKMEEELKRLELKMIKSKLEYIQVNMQEGENVDISEEEYKLILHTLDKNINLNWILGYSEDISEINQYGDLETEGERRVVIIKLNENRFLRMTHENGIRYSKNSHNYPYSEYDCDIESNIELPENYSNRFFTDEKQYDSDESKNQLELPQEILKVDDLFVDEIDCEKSKATKLDENEDLQYLSIAELEEVLQSTKEKNQEKTAELDEIQKQQLIYKIKQALAESKELDLKISQAKLNNRGEK